MSESKTTESGTVNIQVNSSEISNSATSVVSGTQNGNIDQSASQLSVNPDGTETQVKPGDKINETTVKKMTIKELEDKINESITNLKTKLTDASDNIDFQKGDIDDICTTLSGLNLLGEFDKELYSSLNKYFDESYNSIKVDGIDLRVRGSLSQLMYSKIINGKVGNEEWPSEAQKAVFKESLKGPGMFSSMRSSMGSLFGSPSSKTSAPSAEDKAENGKGNGNAEANKVGGKRIIKRKRKFLKKK